MRLQDKLGTNPFKFGMVAGTDTHNGLSTGAEEGNYYGKFAVSEPSPAAGTRSTRTSRRASARTGR